MWVDWQLTADSSPRSIVSSGPSEPVTPGEFVQWDMFVRQGVHFPRTTKEDVSVLDWSTDFKPLLGELNFSFSPKKP